MRGLAAASLAILTPAPWSSADAQHAVAIASESPRSFTAIRFRFTADGPVRGGFGLARNVLLFGTEAGSLYAIDAGTGALRWRRALGSAVLSTPAIAGGRAFLTTRDNRLRAVDAATGRELWRRDLGRTRGANDYWEYYVSSPVISAGRLFVGSGSGRLFAFDAASGRLLWSFDAIARIRSTPVLTPSAIIIGTMSGHVLALDRAHGRLMWRFATEGAAHDFSFKDNDTRSVVTEPVVVKGTVIAGGRDGNVYGIGLSDGRERWRETHDGGSWILGFASDGTRFYSGSGSAFVMQAADPATGKEVWRTATANAMFGGVALAGGVLVSNGNNGNLFGFDARTGSQLWRVRLGDMALSSPLVADKIVYTGADDGIVTAVGTSAAEPRRLVRNIYSFNNEPAASAFWFKPELLSGIRGGFLTSGYTRIGDDELAQALRSPLTGEGRRIIVLADTRLPDGISPESLKSFVEGGGVLVLLGPDPIVYSFDASGAPVSVDAIKEKAAFGLEPANRERDYGYNRSTFTAAARPFGLTGQFVSVGWTRPDQVSTVLATDRSGMATAWVKNFSNGGRLIELPLPRYRMGDTATPVNAIELIVAQGSGASQ